VSVNPSVSKLQTALELAHSRIKAQKFEQAQKAKMSHSGGQRNVTSGGVQQQGRPPVRNANNAAAGRASAICQKNQAQLSAYVKCQMSSTRWPKMVDP
jgi:hypothetical protein